MPKRKNKTEPHKDQPESQQSVVVIHKHPAFIEWIGNRSLAISNSNIVKWLSLLLLLVSALAYHPTIGEDYDIWFHLEYGKHYVENLTWKIDHSQFSWTPSLPDWKYVTWIGSSILYVAHRTASTAGLYIVQWLILLSIFAICLYYIRLLGDTIDITHIMGILLLAIALKLTTVYIKPELFSTLFITASIFIYFYTKLSLRNLLFLYPLLFLVWVNTHGGFIIGLFLISLMFFGEAVNFYFQKKSAMPRRLLINFAIAVSLSYIATLINPYGINYHIDILKYLTAKEYMGEATRLFAYLSMWNYLRFSSNMFNFINSAWSLVTIAVLFGITSVYAYWKDKYFDIAIVLLNVIFFPLSMQAARSTIFYPLVGFFSILYILKKVDALQIKRKFAPAALAIFLFWSIYILHITINFLDNRSWFGARVEEYLPVNEVEYIKKNKLPGPIFNDYVIGAYMMWKMYPDYKVFIDPRYGPYVGGVLKDWFGMGNYMGDPKGLERLLSKYPFKIALLHVRERSIIFWLLSNDWRLAYFDKIAVVLVHKSVIPLLSAEALATDVSPKRFAKLTNPSILLNLFGFYNQIGPVYSREILKIYQQNVTDYYKFKQQHIKSMEGAINQRESELRQKQIQQQNQKTGK